MRNPIDFINSLPPDEPVFVLRAQDKFMPILLSLWIELVDNANGRVTEKTVDVAGLSQHVKEWQREHGCKVPD